MESSTALMPTSTGLSSILLSARTQFYEYQIMKKYQYYRDVRGEVLPTPSGTLVATAE